MPTILDQIADIIAELDMPDKAATDILALHAEFVRREITYRNCMRIPGFRKLYVAIVEAAQSSLRISAASATTPSRPSRRCIRTATSSSRASSGSPRTTSARSTPSGAPPKARSIVTTTRSTTTRRRRACRRVRRLLRVSVVCVQCRKRSRTRATSQRRRSRKSKKLSVFNRVLTRFAYPNPIAPTQGDTR